MNFYTDDRNQLTGRVIGCAIEVHRYLGPGLLESTYEQCLAQELEASGLQFNTQVPVPLFYKGINLNCGYRIDFLVADQLVVQLKSVDELTKLHRAQVLSYMKLAEVPLGLLINFNVRILKNGLKRFII